MAFEMIQLQALALRSFLPAQDFTESLAFYQALGARVEWTDGQLALLAWAGAQIYLQNYYQKDWAENYMLHISVQDVAQCHADIHALLATGRFPNARIAAPKHEAYGALVSYLWDPSGVLLHLVQWDAKPATVAND